MSLPEPFAYGNTRHVRRHAPSGYADHTGFKPWLRDEFSFRCVYCLEREMWSPYRDAVFAVEHVKPKGLQEWAHLARDYANLVYSCTRCNSLKGVQLLIDPTEVPFGEHLNLGDDGLLVAKTREGTRLIEKLHLNANPALATRVDVLNLLRIMRDSSETPGIRDLFLSKFSYPEDLPDLRRARVKNANAPSEDACFHELRRRGTLPYIY